MTHRNIVSPLLCFLVFSLSSFATCCPDTERTALLDFKSLLTDPSNQLNSWQGQNCCSWKGIRCSDSGFVIALNLRNPNPENFILNFNSELVSDSSANSTAIEGTISPSLFTLSHLRYLDISYNNFMFSKLPSGLSNLTRLTYLNLSNAMFEDSITTQLSNFTSLTKLDISCSISLSDFSTVSLSLTSSSRVSFGSLSSYIYFGKLSSSSISWLQGLNKLRELRLSGMDLSKASESTRWAEPLSFLSNLRSLQLSNCKISGRVPVHQILNLTHLDSLIMDSNPLSSQIPNQLANLTSLSTVDFTSSNLQGSIPYLPQLKSLYVGNNYGITIDLSSMFSVPWPRLERLDIQSTHVATSIPDSFANSTMLVDFVADSCLIQGSIPSSIWNLSRLEILELNDNYIRGHISPSIANLKNLRYLYLVENSLTGSIPESICEISTLQYLDLDFNQLTGSLPECIGQLPNLSILYITGNKLMGTIPMSFFHNSKLNALSLGQSGFTVKTETGSFRPNFQPQILELASCNIGGGIPDFIYNLTELVFLELFNNSLSGPIPSWLFNLPKLSFLDLSVNNLQGSLPLNIRLSSSAWPSTINLANNKLQGPIPPRLENVDVINLSGNNLKGYVPTEIGELSNIRYISFSGNKLHGQIPLSFCGKTNVLMGLDLSDNNLSGRIPLSFGNCTSLVYLSLAGNNLGGSIPFELRGVKNLSYLDLSGNDFNGRFPSVISGFQSLEVLNLANNRFEGRIPKFIGNLHALRILVLASNFLNETIPREITQLKKLQYIGFSDNRLSGPIPEILGGLSMLVTRPTDGILLGYVVSLTYAGVQLDIVIKGSYQHVEVHSYDSGIDISCNGLTGKIPEQIGLLGGLYSLNLSHNGLSDEIPKTVGTMRGLESLDLSFNALSGEIPVALTTLDSLTRLNLSYNNLSGKVPSSPHFNTVIEDGNVFYGNQLLCGAQGEKESCTTIGTTLIVEDGDDAREKYLFYAIVMLGYSSGFCVFFLIFCICKGKWKDRYWRAVDRIVLRIIHWF